MEVPPDYEAEKEPNVVDDDDANEPFYSSSKVEFLSLVGYIFVAKFVARLKVSFRFLAVHDWLLVLFGCCSTICLTVTLCIVAKR